MSMNIYAKRGDLVIVTEATKNNGYSVDEEKVEKYLSLNTPYEIDKTVVHDFSTDVYLVAFPSRIFNSVNFEDFIK